MKSLAHPEWPYTGTPHEWRGFAKKTECAKAENAREHNAIYQKQNFGPELK